jgi:MFS_1 like family
MLIFKLWYLTYFASASCLHPFLPLIFRRAGLSEQHVGTIAALRPWVGLPCGAILAGIADKWRKHSIILTTCFTLSVCMRLVVSISTSFPAILTVILIADAINSPTNIIVDAAAIAACSSPEYNNEGKDTYGRQRLYGAIGWGAFSFISGSSQTWFHGSSTIAFILYGVLAITTFIPTVKIPWEPLHAKLEVETHHSDEEVLEEGEGEEEIGGRIHRAGGGGDTLNKKFCGRGGGVGVSNRSRETSPLRHAFNGLKSSSSTSASSNTTISLPPHQKKQPQPPPTTVIENKNFYQKLGILLSSPEALLFFFTVTVMGYAVGTIESFLFLFLEDLGGSESLMGLTLTVTCIAETLIFFYASSIMHFLGLDGCFHLCFFAFLVRLGSYATLSHWKSPWAVLPVELLHGITFGLTWSAGTAKSALIAPPGLEATTQSAFQGFLFGLGYGMGGLMAGRKYHLNGPEAVFKSAFLVVALGWMLTTGIGWCLRKYGWVERRSIQVDHIVYSEVEMRDYGTVGSGGEGRGGRGG